jgi:hypothetical protein
MKRKIFIFIVMTFIIIIVGIDYKPQVVEEKPDAYEVIKYMDNRLGDYPNDINDFYLLFDSYKLDSKNFVQILSFFNNYDYKIIEVYPYINPMYQTMLNNIYKIEYSGKSFEDGIANIYNRYMSELDKYRLSEEIDKILVNGIRIRMIKINLSNDILTEFLRKYSGVKYSLTPYGLFYTF